MALHTALPIHKVAYDLLDVIMDLVKNMPRDFKQSLGGKLRDESIEILTAIFRANCAREKAPHLEAVVERQQVIELMLRLSRDKRLISTGQYARAIQRRPASADFCAGHLTTAFTRAHDRAATEKNVAGFGSPCGAAMSRTAFALRLFCRLGAPSFGRPGGRSRKARRCSTGLPTPVSVALPFGSGMAVQNRNWSTHTMKTTATPFYPCNLAGELLFEVRADIPAINALETVQCYMAAARSSANAAAQLATDDGQEDLWAAYYLIDTACAVLNAVVKAKIEEIRA